MITLYIWEKKKAALNICSSKDYSIGNQKQFKTIWTNNLHLPQIKTVILKNKEYNCTVVEHKSTYYTNPQDFLFHSFASLLGKPRITRKKLSLEIQVFSHFSLIWNEIYFNFCSFFKKAKDRTYWHEAV